MLPNCDQASPYIRFLRSTHTIRNRFAVNPINATHSPITNPLPPSLNVNARKISYDRTTVPIDSAIITMNSPNISV